MRLNIAAIFTAVGLGAASVILVYSPAALIPRAPYIAWISAFFSLAALAMILVLGLIEDFEDVDDTRLIHWRAVVLAFLTSAVACAAFIGFSALADYLDRP